MDTPRSILILTTQFARDDQPAEGVRQLAEAFQEQGHNVDVVVIPWQSPEERAVTTSERGSLRMLRVPPLDWKVGRIPSLLSRWAFSSLAARRHAKSFLAGRRVDLLITFSPAVTMSFLASWALRKWRPRSYLYVVDFFPFHHRSLGLVPAGPVFRLAIAQETRMIRKFDVIGCMSPMNMDYLKRRYRLRESQRVELLPLGTGIQPVPTIDRACVRSRHRLPSDQTIVLFGGQITEGRGIPEILQVAEEAARQGLPLFFLLIGRGRLAGIVKDYVRKGLGNAMLIDQLPRDQYLEVAAACDIGLVVTVAGVDVPTFPSKTLDYLQAGLPVVAAVEASTDYGKFVEEQGIGIAVEAGRPMDILDAILELNGDPSRRSAMAANGHRVMSEVFDVRLMAERIIAQTHQGSGAGI